MIHRNFFYNENVNEQLNEVCYWLLYKSTLFILVLALKWFRCETDMEVVRAEIHEMEADFNNLQTNSTKVIKTTNEKQ